MECKRLLKVVETYRVEERRGEERERETRGFGFGRKKKKKKGEGRGKGIESDRY